MSDSDPGISQHILFVVAAIPKGKVTTYGAIARKAGLGRAARRVGYVLRELPVGTRIPWHRVVNAKGCISFPKGSAPYKSQKARLEAEGIQFSSNGSVDLRLHGW